MTLDFNENTPSGLEREFPKSLIGWYDFHKDAKALFISGGLPEGEVLSEVLDEAGLDVCVRDITDIDLSMDLNEQGSDNDGTYDYIVGFGVLEKAFDPIAFLIVLKGLLNKGGVMLLGCENRLGMRYFCGDKDAFTNRCFDGIEGYFDPYSDLHEKSGRAYAHSELEDMLNASGFGMNRFYSVMPVLDNPRLLFAEDHLPEEVLDVRMTPQYRDPETVFIEEERTYQTLIDNGLFHSLANGYLIEAVKCSGQMRPEAGDEKAGNVALSNVRAVTSSLDRGRELATYTIIRRDDRVEKRAAYADGQKRISELSENDRYLREHGIKTVDGELKEEHGCTGIKYVMPYIKSPTATEYFRGLIENDVDKFYKELDRFMELVDSSSEHVPYSEVDWERFDPEWKSRKKDDPNRYKWRDIAKEAPGQDLGYIMKKGFVDLVCLNCFVIGGEFVFFDQEFAIDDLPANVIKLRTIDNLCTSDTDRKIPRDDLLERYQLTDYIDLWRSYENIFITRLRNRSVLSAYYTEHERDGQSAAINKNRINYPEAVYERVFKDIFKGIKNKEIFVFGSGVFAQRFLSRYEDMIPIKGVIDNDPQKQGQKIGRSGLVISSPDVLKEVTDGSVKVFVCIKRYHAILSQLEAMGIKNCCIYNPDVIYPPGDLAPDCRRIQDSASDPERTGNIFVAERSYGKDEGNIKKYHIGYISGVFDLFHMGHVNLLRRAKEQCDHLIVGVVTDEQVINSKKTSPRIPFEQRIEVVRACRYVDEAVRIPPEYADSREAYMRYHFDVQFSGSDYENDQYWLTTQQWLRKQGSDLVFFPYTEGVSSTMIKEKLSEETTERK